MGSSSDLDRRRIVEVAYDTLGPRFGAWDERIEGDPWARFLDELVARMPEGGRLLDLGCGNGTNIGLVLEAGFELAHDELVWMREPQGEIAFVWLLARKPS